MFNREKDEWKHFHLSQVNYDQDAEWFPEQEKDRGRADQLSGAAWLRWMKAGGWLPNPEEQCKI